MLATALLACGTTVNAAATGGTGGSSSLPFALGPILTYGIAVAILGAGIIVLVVIVALWRRNDPVATPAPGRRHDFARRLLLVGRRHLAPSEVATPRP